MKCDAVASNCKSKMNVNMWQCNAQYSCFKNDVCMQGLSKLMIQVKKGYSWLYWANLLFVESAGK